MLTVLNRGTSLALVGVIMAFALEPVNLYPALSGLNTLWVDDDDPTCGGSSPCYSTIQEAVAAAQAGDTIRVRPGTYEPPIVIKKSLTLLGESRESVVIQCTEPDQMAITISGPAIVKIENISIAGKSFGSGVFLTAGVVISGQSPQVVINRTSISKHVIAISLTADEPYSQASSNGHLVASNNEISNNWTGIFIATDGSYIQNLENNELRNNGIAFDIIGKGSVSINRNQIVTNGTGVEVKGAVEAIIQTNVVQDNGNGVKVNDTAGIQLERNQITNNSLNGVIVRDTSRAILRNNQIFQNGFGSSSLSIPPSFLYDPFFGFLTSGGIFQPQGFGVVVGLAASVELTGNRIEDNLFGVGATKARDPTSNQFLIPQLTAQENQIKENGWGIWLRGAEATLKDNEIAQNDVIALPIDLRLVAWLEWLFPASGVLVQSGQPLLQSNRITQNSLGIVLQEQSSPTMLGNQILNNAQYGIALYLKPCFDQLAAEIAFQGKVLGEANELSGNGQGDLCPADYPWPPGFRK